MSTLICWCRPHPLKAVFAILPQLEWEGPVMAHLALLGSLGACIALLKELINTISNLGQASALHYARNLSAS